MHDDPAHAADLPGIVAPPPLIFAVALASGIAVDKLTKAAGRRSPYQTTIGALSVAAGVALGALTIAQLRRARTAPSPYVPTTALVTGGMFGWTRNPAYVGATSIYIGVALLAPSQTALTFLPIALAVLDRDVVAFEERYLSARFGDSYRDYQRRVPRWF